MPNFPIDFIYNGQPLDARYWRYSLRCYVSREDDKAYYWSKMKEIWNELEPKFAGWKDIYLNSDQALFRMIGKPDPDGTYRGSGEKAAVGGLQKLSRESLEKVCTKYLSDNAHLIDRFENSGRASHRFFTPAHPKCVHFFLTEITASRTRTRRDKSQTYRYSPHDFWLQVGGYHHQQKFSRQDPINQAIDIYISQDVWNEATSDQLAMSIGALTDAVHIWKSESGFRGTDYVTTEGNMAITYSVEDEIDAAIDGQNRFGSMWLDLLKTE
jgi:hypothetical protein